MTSDSPFNLQCTSGFCGYNGALGILGCCNAWYVADAATTLADCTYFTACHGASSPSHCDVNCQEDPNILKCSGSTNSTECVTVTMMDVNLVSYYCNIHDATITARTRTPTDLDQVLFRLYASPVGGISFLESATASTYPPTTAGSAMAEMTPWPLHITATITVHYAYTQGLTTVRDFATNIASVPTSIITLGGQVPDKPTTFDLRRADIIPGAAIGALAITLAIAGLVLWLWLRKYAKTFNHRYSGVPQHSGPWDIKDKYQSSLSSAIPMINLTPAQSERYSKQSPYSAGESEGATDPSAEDARLVTHPDRGCPARDDEGEHTTPHRESLPHVNDQQ